MTHSTVIAFVARSPCLLAASVLFGERVQVCRNDACRQRSLLYFYLLSNLFSSDNFIESSEQILLELRPF